MARFSKRRERVRERARQLPAGHSMKGKEHARRWLRTKRMFVGYIQGFSEFRPEG